MVRSAECSRSKGFPPVAGADVRVLVLGSLPSQASLKAQEYYAHPRNSFWRIMTVIADATGDYDERCEALVASGIALWDVLASSVRPGSLDADIRLDSAVPNDFETFLSEHPGLRMICFNGRKAEQMFRRLLRPKLDLREIKLETLPSTSPANAAVPFAAKLDIWRDTIDAGLSAGRGLSRGR